MKTLTNERENKRWFAAPPRPERPAGTVFFLAAGILSLAWMAGTSWVVLRTSTVGSPDEAANQLFISRLATTGSYRIDTGLSSEEAGIVHPRSIAVRGSDLLPGSFLGLVQAGGLAVKAFGPGAERFLTPLLAWLALLALYLVFRRFWSRWWALAGVALLAIHPVFFQFATLPYLHNGAFAAVLVIAGWLLMRLLERPSWSRSVLFGLGYGFALFLRPIEALWTVPVITIVLLTRPGGWKWLAAALAAMLAVQSSWMLANRDLFGSWLSSGYTPEGIFTDAAGASALVNPVRQLLTPVGGQWSWHWLSSTWWYLLLLVPAWSAMTLVSLAAYFKRKYTTFGKALKLSLISLVALFPLVYYGSWELYPQTPASSVGSLSSYARYWLPLFIAMTPGMVLALRRLRQRWIVGMVIIFLAVSQLAAMIIHPVSGLQARFKADDAGQSRRQFILNSTPADAVIVAGHQDKYVYWDRLTMFALPAESASWKILANLARIRPTYIYVAPFQYDLVAVGKTLATYNLQLTNQRLMNRDQLWRITPL